ncbi:hypothetical protein Godav_001126, partial [Gossypium davidsonii]|nr:hypothetical protein [Gossypium davidsonii]
KTQLEKGDSLTEGYTSELWDFSRIRVTQNNLQELKEIWAQWDDEVKQLFYLNYGDPPYLLDVKVDKHLFQSLAQFWNSAYSCFIFEKVYLVPTVEEYIDLLRCPRIQVDKAYFRTINVSNFVKKLMNITGMSEKWATARIKQKGESKCIPWKNLRDLILAHPDKKKKRVTPAPVVLAKTFRSLSACWRTGEGRFVGCAQLLLAATPRRDNVTKERWILILQNLQDEDIEWRARWLVPDEILYRCGDFDWVPLLGIWGAVGYAPVLILRQYRSRQKKIREMSNAWNQTRWMKRFAVGKMKTPKYGGWLSKRVNDNIPRPSQEGVRSMEEYLQVVPSDIEIIKQDFERINSKIGKKIEQLEEEKMHLRLDVDVQKLETKKLRKGKNKAEEDLDKQWRQEIREEKIKANRWERKFQEAQMRNDALEKGLSES